MNLVKGCIRDLEPYIVPQDASVVKLNQNESSVDVPKEIKDAICSRLQEISWNRYPDGGAKSLLQKIFLYTNFPAEGILVGNASNELIQTVVYASCDSGDRIVTVTPGFSVFGRVASIMGIEKAEVPLLEDFTFNVPGIIKEAENAKLVILASPNNPTGTFLPVEQIEEIARSIGGMLVVDEAYHEFHKESAQDLVGKYPNLVILRTFSKALRLASARLGYLLGNPEVVGQLTKARLPFSVGVFQQIAGEILIDHRAVLHSEIEEIISERERVFVKLEQLKGINPIPSRANFILFEVEGQDVEELHKRLHAQGVLLRYIGGARLKNMLRVTIGTRRENDIFLEKLRQMVGTAA